MSAGFDRARLQRLCDEHDFTREYGLIVEEAAPALVRVEAPFRAHYVRPGGVVPGFIYMTVADVTLWLAVLALLGEPGLLAVTTEMRTSFLGTVRNAPFWCEAGILDEGERLLFGTATCRDKAGTIATHHTMNYIRPPERWPTRYQRRPNET